MCSRIAEAQCCICRRYLDQTNHRIIVEICGHQKCRECFIKEEEGCSLCSKTDGERNHSECILAVPSSSSDGIGEIGRDDHLAEPSETMEMNDVASHIITTTENEGGTRFKCTICQKSFKSRNNCKYHLFCDKTRSKPFQCNQCDKQFITLAHMNYHQSTHIVDKHFSCPHCQKVYSGDVALKKHMRKHQNDFKYQCQQCDEKFLYKEQLNIHQNRHNNIFHKCPECDKRFLIKSNLTKHVQSHTGVNRKICPICKNSFSGNSALKTHMLTHSKSKPFQCEKCSKKFIDQRTLERHLKTHTDNQFYFCTLCSAKSGRKDNIRRHVRNLHSESDDELRLILEKIFDNFERKKNNLTVKSIGTREEKTEKEAAKNTERSTNISVCVEQTAEANAIIEEPIKSPNVVRNIATSVIKFVGRSQDIQSQIEEEKCSQENQGTSPALDETETFEQNTRIVVEHKPESSLDLRETVAVDPITEIGVNLQSLEPLNFDSFPDIRPLPLLNTNTNTNLTVYRQLLSPYLKKSINSNADSSNNTANEPPNKHLKPGPTTTMVIDRPPKKMIEKYEIYRN